MVKMVKNGQIAPEKKCPRVPVWVRGGVLLFGQCPNKMGTNYKGASLTITMLLSNNKPHQQVQFAPSQSLPLLANPALSLENLTATTRMNLRMPAVAIVRTSKYPVSLTTRPLALDSGRCHHLLAPQTAVAVRVSGVENVFLLNLHLLDFCS